MRCIPNQTAAERRERRQLAQPAQIRLRGDEARQKIRSRVNLPHRCSITNNRWIGPNSLREIFRPPGKSTLVPQTRLLLDLQSVEVVLHHRQSAVDFCRRHDRAVYSGSRSEGRWFKGPLSKTGGPEKARSMTARLHRINQKRAVLDRAYSFMDLQDGQAFDNLEVVDPFLHSPLSVFQPED